MSTFVGGIYSSAYSSRICTCEAIPDNPYSSCLSLIGGASLTQLHPGYRFQLPWNFPLQMEVFGNLFLLHGQPSCWTSMRNNIWTLPGWRLSSHTLGYIRPLSLEIPMFSCRDQGKMFGGRIQHQETQLHSQNQWLSVLKEKEYWHNLLISSCRYQSACTRWLCPWCRWAETDNS